MKAIGYSVPTKTLNQESLQSITLPIPEATGYDLLIEIKAISVNPVDTKVRAGMAPNGTDYQILGWDAVGVVKAVGEKASLFNIGDKVFYAGDISRPGSNAEYQLVDERIAGWAPTSLSDAEAAALPLTAITAWELLFDRLQIDSNIKEVPATLLVIGAAGGVGSILVQLARQLTNIQIIGTASRPESQAWLNELGAHQVINHREPLSQGLAAIGVESVDYVISLTNTADHYPEIIKSLKPQGKLALIDDPATLDVMQLKQKSLSLHWEFMFTRSLFQTDDLLKQHQLLNKVSQLIDDNVLKTTLGKHLGKITVANLLEAHQILESQMARGKLVLEGFEK